MGTATDTPDTELLAQLGYMHDHPGTLGRATAYMGKLELDRRQLIAEANAVLEAFMPFKQPKITADQRGALDNLCAVLLRLDN